MAVAQVRDVAAKAGVSPATVSNALNHPHKVTEATRERVHQAIEELGFVRNDAARQLRSGSSRSVGMIVLDVGNPFFTDVAAGVETALAAHHRPLILGNSAQSPAREQQYLDLFEEQRVSGLLLTPAGDVLSRLRRLRDRGIAVVLVDRKVGVREFSSVSVDDTLGGRLATEHLLNIGRRRILVAGGPVSISQVRTRVSAARAAVERFGEGSIEFIDTAAMDLDAGRRAATEIVQRKPSARPDAVFAANDLVALGALQVLTQHGVRVPDDIALIGYDDIDFAGSATIALSSIRQPAHEMGARAAAMLLNLIDGVDTGVHHPQLTPELVIRQSTSGADNDG